MGVLHTMGKRRKGNDALTEDGQAGGEDLLVRGTFRGVCLLFSHSADRLALWDISIQGWCSIRTQFFRVPESCV